MKGIVPLAAGVAGYIVSSNTVGALVTVAVGFAGTSETNPPSSARTLAAIGAGVVVNIVVAIVAFRATAGALA